MDMRKGPPAWKAGPSAALAVLALAACSVDTPAPTTAEVDALAQSVKDAITTDALMTFSGAIAEHVRPSGSPGENAAIDTIVATLEARGVPVAVHELDAYASDPVSASVTIPGTDFAPEAITMAYSASSAGTVGEAVDMGTLADLPRLEVGTGERLVIEGEDFGADLPDLTGRVAIVDGQPRNLPTIAMERMGAAAIVFINPEERLNDLIVTSTWGSPSLMNYHRLPGVPVAQIARSAGEELRARMAAGPVELRVETEVATGWKPLRLAVATIEPTGTDSAPYVLLGGHIDGWYHGATDEAASNAAMLALALAFHNVRDQLRHGLVVAWWPGHSNARYAGSTWFADEHFTDLRTRGLAYMNIDGVGQMESQALRRLRVGGVPALRRPRGPGDPGRGDLPVAAGSQLRPGLQRRRPAADPVQPHPAGGGRRLLVVAHARRHLRQDRRGCPEDRHGHLRRRAGRDAGGSPLPGQPLRSGRIPGRGGRRA